MRNPFTAHPSSVGETYIEHAKFASLSGARMIIAGMACIIHGILPFLFVQTGSQTITGLHEKFSTHAKKNIQPLIIDTDE